MVQNLKTCVYIDGYNLYHRALRGTEFRWLDVAKLSEVLFPSDEIKCVGYFTARVLARRANPGQPQRQQIYLRALGTLPKVEIHFGTYRERVIERPLSEPVRGLPRYVRVLNSEEKGTDVNLTTRLLVDGFEGKYDQAVLITNDSDFVSPIRFVRDHLNLKILIVNPDNSRNTPNALKSAATGIRRLRKSHLRRSQLPPIIRDRHGTITKPPPW